MTHRYGATPRWIERAHHVSARKPTLHASLGVGIGVGVGSDVGEQF